MKGESGADAGALVGALAGALAATRAGAECRAAVLVGHKWVVVLVVLVVVGGRAMVVGGTGMVVVVVCCTLFECGAVGSDALELARCGCGGAVTLTESMAITAPAVTRGAATIFVAG